MYGTSMNFPGGIFGELERLSRELDVMFGQPAAAQGIRNASVGTFPPINIGTTAISTEIFAFLPGVDPASVELSLDKGVLTLAGERPSTLPAESDQVSIYRRQRFSGKFKRAITVPDDIDPDQVTASYRDGVLSVSLKRSAASLIGRPAAARRTGCRMRSCLR